MVRLLYIPISPDMIRLKNTVPFLSDFPYQFSICTIINDADEYEKMKLSFDEAGFTTGCEYLLVNNIHSNEMDAYGSIGSFLQKAQGEFIIIVHQDVRCIDSKDDLVQTIAHLEENDPDWAVGGNAGCNGYHNCFYHLVDAGIEKRTGGLPQKVTSLDENFLIVKASSRVKLSKNLKGFHLYGTDLCINADLAGFNSYVIPFLVSHLSRGNLHELNNYQNSFVREYNKNIKGRFVQTTCTGFYLGSSLLQTTILNYKPVFALVKAWQRVKRLSK